MDLLRVISHHRARLATPIRTVQRIYRDADMDNVPFSDIFTQSRAAPDRPFLLIEPSYKINGEEKTKPSSRPSTNLEEKEGKPVTQVTSLEPTTDPNPKPTSEPKTPNAATPSPSPQPSSSQPPSPQPPSPQTLSSQPPSSPSSSSSSANARTALEDNIVLGVALEGSKRMLPIEDEIEPTTSPNLSESKELASCLNGNGGPTSAIAKDQKDDQSGSIATGTVPTNEQREQEKRQ